MSLPLALSVPHAGTEVPPEIRDLCILAEEDIVADGDEGAAEIYFPLSGDVAAFVATPIARAIVDQNRAVEDRRKDGVVKTHTCWDVPVYRSALTQIRVRQLLNAYYVPYHAQLTAAARPGVHVGIDCHTMAATAPPVAPDPGAARPLVCLSDGGGSTCPKAWVGRLYEILCGCFDGEVRLNDPFSGGYITRRHSREMAWLQLEISRTPSLSNRAKSQCVRAALGDWCRAMGWI